ncbi:uncharacterized protein LOC114745107 [Neltuma alba]|uniref:uncharacterized protein LOC114745107 n=1 Tax=Neltuma alba TaxID=207710 RepID=UPI0010A2B54B|nr:uncharacterized protein LOC114745107 [Prosopis alba]
MVDFVFGERTNNNEHDKKWPPLLQSVVEENGDELKFTLEAEDDMKNTPLHLAVSEENIKMCKKIGGAHPSTITKRNNAGETPLFIAALRGERKIFLWLHYLYMASPGVSSTDFAHCLRRDNDDTVLHCAIAHGHLGK